MLNMPLLSCSPHCSHKLQTLNCSVHGPLKKQINIACDAGVCTNKRPMTIYDIQFISVKVFPMELTSVNISADFQHSEILHSIFKYLKTPILCYPTSLTSQPLSHQIWKSPKILNRFQTYQNYRLFIDLIQTQRKHYILLHKHGLALLKKLDLYMPGTSSNIT